MMRRVIVIAGPTAVGKTGCAVEVAEAFNGEIVSADSMQIYKHMDVGSAKPGAEELSRARHHLVGEIDPREPFSVALYQKLAKGAIEGIFSRGKQPIVSGGTGLYVNSLIYDMDFTAPPPQDDGSGRRELEELAALHGSESVHGRLAAADPEAAARIHPNNLKRVIRALEVIEGSGRRIRSFEDSFVKTADYGTVLIGLTRDRQELYDRINARVGDLIEGGLVSEVESLAAMGLDSGDISMKGIGYKEILGHLRGEYGLDTAADLIRRNTRRYAKRQLTWLRRYDDMKWFNLSENSKCDEFREILEWLSEKM